MGMVNTFNYGPTKQHRAVTNPCCLEGLVKCVDLCSEEESAWLLVRCCPLAPRAFKASLNIDGTEEYLDLLH